MATGQPNEVIRHLQRAVLREDGAGLSDGQLLEGFVSGRDSAALAALVRRHGPMVWGVCRRVLRDHHDAEDAFQATFLVLVRKAASITSRELVANWLYGVAHQTAMKARATAARRQGRERPLTEAPEPEGVRREPRDDLRPLLDQELSRLPDRYRLPIVLCDLQGKTRKEVARQLGCPEGTVAGRLARARALLAKRLARRGVVLSGAALAAALAPEAVPAAVASSTAQVASVFTDRPAAAALAEGVLRAMLLTKLKTVALVVLMIAAAGVGAGSWLRYARAGEPSERPSVVTGGELPAEPPGAEDLLKEQRERALIEKQRLIQKSVEAARQNIEKLLKDVEQETGSKQASREALEEIEKAVNEMLGRAEGEERQEKAVWNLDFRFKSPRLLTLKAPEAGGKAATVWYWWYEVVNNTDESHLFLPAFEAVTSDKVYHDEVRGGLTEAVRRIEDPTRALDLKNSVTIATEPVPPSKLIGDKKGVVGVAFWGYADADAANAKEFTVFVSGLSNAWSSEGGVVRRKVLRVGFRRVGNEMVATGPAEWVYRPYKASPAEEDGETPLAEIRRLVAQLAGLIADLEMEPEPWKEERQRLQDRVREYRHMAESIAENPPKDWKEEDRAAARREMAAKIREVERKIAAGDAREAERRAALESYKRRLEDLRRLLPPRRDEPAPGRAGEAEQLRRAIAGLGQQRKAWQKEQEQLKAVIVEWKKLVEEATPDRRKDKEAVLKELERQLQSGEQEDQGRQSELERLDKKLKALGQPPARPDGASPPRGRTSSGPPG